MWRVGYKMQHTIPRPEAKKMAKVMGMDMVSNEYREKVLAGASSYGEEAVAAAKKDLDTAAVWYSIAVLFHSGGVINVIFQVEEKNLEEGGDI